MITHKRITHKRITDRRERYKCDFSLVLYRKACSTGLAYYTSLNVLVQCTMIVQFTMNDTLYCIDILEMYSKKVK